MAYMAAFKEYNTFLIILLIGQFINMTTGSVNVLLMMTNNENIVRLNTSISAIMCLLLGIIFIPKFGIMAQQLLHHLQ